jgi:hypothetical protein
MNGAPFFCVGNAGGNPKVGGVTRVTKTGDNYHRHFRSWRYKMIGLDSLARRVLSVCFVHWVATWFRVPRPEWTQRRWMAMLLAYRLVKLIETHSDQLAAGALEKLQNCPRTSSFRDVPAEEFKQRVYEIYHSLGEWLLGKTESDIERRYTEIGRRREAQGVPLSQLICAINITKQYLLEYLASEAVTEKSVELFGEIEVLQLLEQFFDRANYYAAVGYENAHAALGTKSVLHS